MFGLILQFSHTITIEAYVDGRHFLLVVLNLVCVWLLVHLLIFVMLFVPISWTVWAPCRLFLRLELDLLILLVDELTFVHCFYLLAMLLILYASSILTHRLVLAAFAWGSSIVILIDHYDVSIVAVVVGFVCGTDLIILSYTISELFTFLYALIIIWFTFYRFGITILLENIWATFKGLLCFSGLLITSVLTSFGHALFCFL